MRTISMGKLGLAVALLLAICVDAYYVPGTYPREFNVDDVLQGGSAPCKYKDHAQLPRCSRDLLGATM
jgi:hypothetical protein